MGEALVGCTETVACVQSSPMVEARILPGPFISFNEFMNLSVSHSFIHLFDQSFNPSFIQIHSSSFHVISISFHFFNFISFHFMSCHFIHSCIHSFIRLSSKPCLFSWSKAAQEMGDRAVTWLHLVGVVLGPVGTESLKKTYSSSWWKAQDIDWWSPGIFVEVRWMQLWLCLITIWLTPFLHTPSIDIDHLFLKWWSEEFSWAWRILRCLELHWRLIRW